MRITIDEKLKNRFRNINLKRSYREMRESKRTKRGYAYLQKRPFLSLSLALLLLLGLMSLGNLINSFSKKEEVEPVLVKNVQTFDIGEAPKVTVQAKLEKKGVIQIIAQTPGIVQSINYKEGTAIQPGQSIVSLSTNYQGGNAPALQAQLAGAQYRNITDTYADQKDVLQKQKQIAENTRENTKELNTISKDSVSDTRSFLDLSEGNLRSIDQSLQTLRDTNVDGANDALIQQTNQAKSQVVAGVTQLRTALKNLEYTSNTDNPPTKLADLQKDTAIKQLNLQEKALDLNKEITGIQYNLALVNQGLMYPASPFAGTVEKINVSIGDQVNPGTVIATIACNELEATAVASVPREIANTVSRVEKSTITLDDQKISVVPTYVSKVATDGQLYSITFDLPDAMQSKFANEEYVSMEIPIGYKDSASSIPFIPIDSVYQTQDEAYVYVAARDKASIKNVKLGNVYGKYVEVQSGLEKGDKVILNRNVIAGDAIKI